MLSNFKKHIGTNFPELFISRIAIGMSGGKDSTVLAHLLHQFQIKFDLIHCNFNLRGVESDKDQNFVEQLAAQFNCELYTESFNTKEVALNKRISIQMAARELRYAAFNKIAKKHDYDCVLVAHHLPDQLETFLINLGRGTGLHGLTGIKSHNGKITRPLLPFTRDQIDRFALKNNLKWREDSSNQSTKYQRNELRHDVIPKLHNALPNLKNSFYQTLNYLKGAEMLMDVEVARFRESGTKINNGNLEINIEKLKVTVHPETYLFELLKEHNFNLPDALQLLDADNGKSIYSDKMQLTKDRDVLVLREILPIENIHLEINNLNETVAIGDLILELKTVKVKEPINYLKSNLKSNKLFLDVEELKLPLTLRTWTHGDRMQPYGMKGSKLISDLLTDGKISSLKREKALVLISGKNIIWLLGKRASKHHQITTATKTIIEITLKL